MKTERIAPITKTQLDTLERLTRTQNNYLIPLTDAERDQMHALLRTLRARHRWLGQPDPFEEGGS